MDEAQDEREDSIPADPSVKNYSFTVVDGMVYYRENSRMHPAQLSETAAQRVRGLIGLRNCVRSLITLETEDRPEPEIEAKQAELNQRYDDFQQDFGLINNQQNRRVFSDDDSYYLLCSLEILDEEGQLERKADMFTKRTIRPKESVTHVETAQEALTICLNDLAAVDIDYCAIRGALNISCLRSRKHGPALWRGARKWVFHPMAMAGPVSGSGGVPGSLKRT